MRQRWKPIVLSAALILGVTPAVPARAAAAVPGAGEPARTVTLITGDRVTLLGATGVSVIPGPGRDDVSMITSTAGGRTTVIPADTLPLLRADRLDRRLFDVTGLIDAGYDDRRADLPLIVAGTPAVGSVVRQLPAIKATAIRAPKRELRTTWKSLAAEGKVWLDAVGHFTGAEGVQQIGAPTAWRAGYTGKGVTVGIIDSGVDVTHPDLAGLVTAQRDFSQPENTGDIHDVVGHGTQVASIVAGSGAGSNGRYRGVAPGVRIVSAKGGDWGVTESAVIAAMEWLSGTEHADVVNMSVSFPDSPGTDAMEAAVADLTRRDGTLFVVAAGNDGNNGNNPNGGSDYRISSPGSAPDALTVGAVDHDDNLADFSSRGPALGDTVKPDVTAPGVDITGALSRDAGGSDTELYTTGYGTSYATPHVTGAAALLLQAHPDWTPAMVKAALMATARSTPGVGVFAQGAGRVDVPAALGTALFADPPSVSLGAQAWPHTPADVIQRTVTYRNTSATPMTVNLKLDLKAPTGLFTLSPSTLSVPAGGSAQATVTAAPMPSAPDGAYSGQIVATAGSTVVHTPVGLIRQAETHDLTIHQIDRSGADAAEFYTEIVGLDTPFRWDSLLRGTWDPSYTVRLPRGRYAVVSRVFDRSDGGRNGTVLVHPNLTVDADTDLALDARAGKPVGVAVPEAGAVLRTTTFDVGLRTPAGWDSEGTYIGGTTRRYTAQLGTGDPAGFVTAISASLDDGNDPSAYAYQLGWVLPGELPTGFTRTVTAQQVARESVRASHQAPGSAARLGATLVPAGYPVVTTTTDTAVASEVRYYAQGASGWIPQLAEYAADDQDPFGGVTVTGEPVAYRPGGTSSSRWNAPVIGPCLTSGGGVSWSDGRMTVRVPMACDVDGHAGTQASPTGTTTLYRDGAEVATSDVPGHATFFVAPAAGTYRLNAEATRGAPYLTSTEARVDWTFTDPSVLPNLYTVRMGTGLDGAAPAGPFTLPLTTSTRAATVTLKVSYDDGATWQPMTVRKTGAGAYRAGLVHPASGFASLRVTAAGGGSAVTQTVIRAYRIGA
ncbi:S8 family serine peptidase [Actinoplanes sp. CA-131856]